MTTQFLTPFTQQGPTQSFVANVSGSVPAPVQVPSSAVYGVSQYILTNRDLNNIAWVAHHPIQAVALAAAVIPAVGAPQNVIPVLPQSQVNVTGLAGEYFTGITAGGTAAIDVTPGNGT